LVTIHRRRARLSSQAGNGALAKCSPMDRNGSIFMKLKSQLVQRSELIVNWLALFVLLALGIIWPY
jgi:hypothetical protein